MRRFFLVCIFLIGLFSITAPPSKAEVNSTSPPGDKVSSWSADQGAVQAQVMFAVDEVVPDVPTVNNSPDVNLLTAGAGILIAIYELVVRLVPTSKSISVLAFLYKVLTAIIPDRSQNGGTFTIRDKL
jgi:hypothetical protein